MKTINIKRLSKKTLIKDCNESLADFLGLSYEEVHGVDWRSCSVVGDFEDVWELKIGKKHVSYFHKLNDLIEFLKDIKELLWDTEPRTKMDNGENT